MAFGGGIHATFHPVFGAVTAATTPYSLLYSGGQFVDCGNNASVVGLNAGAMTVDVLWKSPSAAQVWAYRTLVAQSTTSPDQGWRIWADFGSSGNDFLFQVRFTPHATISVPSTRLLTLDTWYHLRAIKSAAGDGSGKYNYAYVNANQYSGTARMWSSDTISSANLFHGKNASGSYLLTGNLCYVHIWNVALSQLSSVPSAPFAVDANTMARWVHSEGAGTVLADTSGNGNNGTISGASWSTVVPPGWTL